jgi:hypothetical protein
MIDTGLLSPAAKQVLSLNADRAYRELVPTGDGLPEAKKMLDALGPASLLAKPPTRTDEAQAALSGLWLWHDWLDHSHTISQGIHNATGSMWHAIMHRREGDFSNSKYWYAKCRDHPALAAMAPKAAEIVRSSKNPQAVSGVLVGGWNPDAMVDLAEEYHRAGDSAAKEAVIALQIAEWETLFELTLQAAV